MHTKVVAPSWSLTITAHKGENVWMYDQMRRTPCIHNPWMIQNNQDKTRTTVRPQRLLNDICRLGCLRTINPNMINHFTKRSPPFLSHICCLYTKQSGFCTCSISVVKLNIMISWCSVPSRRTHHVTITPPLRQNNVAMTFGVIMTLLRHLYVVIYNVEMMIGLCLATIECLSLPDHL